MEEFGEGSHRSWYWWTLRHRNTKTRSAIMIFELWYCIDACTRRRGEKKERGNEGGEREWGRREGMREERGKERSSRGKERVRYIYIMIDKIVFVCVKWKSSYLYCMRPDQPFDQERDLKRKRKEKESQIQKVEEAAKRLKNSTSIHVLAFYLNISSFSLSLFFLLLSLSPSLQNWRRRNAKKRATSQTRLPKNLQHI